jgi:hypothetical protein
MVLREIPAMVEKLPPLPNYAQQDIDAGMPELVVVARVKGRSRVAAAALLAIGLVVSVALCVAAYLRRHRLLPQRR